jgi:hypothetical protein
VADISVANRAYSDIFEAYFDQRTSLESGRFATHPIARSGLLYIPLHAVNKLLMQIKAGIQAKRLEQGTIIRGQNKL